MIYFQIIPYKDALNNRQTTMGRAKTAYIELLRAVLPEDDWVNRRPSWQQVLNELVQHQAYLHFVQLYGGLHAQRIYKQYVREIR